MKLEFSGQIFEKYSNIKFIGNPSSGSRVVPRKDMTDLTATFRNFAKALKNSDPFLTDNLLLDLDPPLPCRESTLRFKMLSPVPWFWKGRAVGWIRTTQVSWIHGSLSLFMRNFLSKSQYISSLYISASTKALPASLFENSRITAASLPCPSPSATGPSHEPCILSSASLTLILLTWRIGWAPNNASRWQMGFN